jgi:hypothetical protein
MNGHTFEDAGYVTNMETGVRVDLQHCTTCLLATATDTPYDVECPGEPSPVNQKIYDLTEGLRRDIAVALGLSEGSDRKDE